MRGFTSEVLAESEKQRAGERDEPLVDLKQGDGQEHADGFGDKFVVQHDVVPLGGCRLGANLAPSMVESFGARSVAVVADAGHGAAQPTYAEPGYVARFTADRQVVASTFTKPEVDCSNGRASA